MPPERYPLSQDDGDGGGGGGVSLTAVNGGGTIIGGHVTVETSSPVASPIPGQFDATTTTTVATPNGSSMVLSTIPVETAHQLILQQQLAQQHHIITTSNTNQNSSAISSSATGNTGIIINNNNNNTSFKNHNNIIISSSGGLAAATAGSNNHTYTINLSGGHNGHAVITNGVPLQGYSSVTTSNSNGNSTTLNSSNHSHHHHQQQYHHLHHSASNGGGSSAANLVVTNSGMATAVHSNGSTTTAAPPGAQTTASLSLPPPSQQATSKLVVVQQGHLGENYITTTESMNGVGNIVLLATEQMDSDHDILNGNSSTNHSTNGGNLVITSSNNVGGHHLSHHQHPGTATIRPAATTTTTTVVVNGNNDEELTPLTWLHDKNLLKGINLSKVPVSSPDSPRQVVGRLSPTSDFVEDSSVSEDNTSSANSSSDQSIGVYCTETIHPGGRLGTVHHSSSLHHHHQLQQQQPQHHTTFQLNNGTGHKMITTTINGDTIIEYTSSSDDKDALKSPSSTVSCASSSSSSSPPSSNSSLYSSSSPSPNPNALITTVVGQNGGGGGGSGASTPHQHFHKKYLREEHVKQLKQVSSSYATPVKQQSALKYDDSDLVDDRSYPSAPVKNGSGGYTMAASPNVSSDEYSSTYGGSMKPPSPPLSPQHQQMGGTATATTTVLSGIHALPLQQQPPASPLPSPVGNGTKLSPPKAKHPTNVPYDPQVHVHSKPPFSFSSLIFMAIENCQQKALPVKEIYAWIVQHFPYFKTAPTGWKNSVRHNLSLNKCFQKVEKAANLGKGSLWMVEPQYRPNLIQALSRSPFHSGSGIDKTTYKAMQQQAQQQQQQHQRSTDSPTSSVGSNYSKDNFPYLASRLAPGDVQNGVHLHHLHGQSAHSHPDMDGDDFSRSSTPIDYDGGDLPHQSSSLSSSLVTPGSYHVTYHPTAGAAISNGINYSTATGVGAAANGIDGPGSTGAAPASGADANGRDWSADTIDDVNAATAMLALKHGPKVFTEGFHNGTPPVITTSPSEDHTYSAGGSIPPAGVTSGRSSQTNSDNNSNGTSSDAAYESSEESQIHTATDDLEEQRRQAGVDALLNLAGITNYSTSSIQTISSSLKRPASSLEPEPATMVAPPSSAAAVIYQQYLESTPPSGYSTVMVQQQQQQPQPHRNYYMPDDLSQYSSPSPPKKSKTSSARMLKKFKKKATWVR